LTKDLVTAYVSSGIDISNAEELAKVSLIDSVRNNSNVESVKLAMSIGKFDTIEEVLTKIVSVPQNTPQVFFANKVFNHRGRHFRGRRPFNRNFIVTIGNRNIVIGKIMALLPEAGIILIGRVTIRMLIIVVLKIQKTCRPPVKKRPENFKSLYNQSRIN